MKSRVLTIIIIIIVAFAAFLTNPSEEKHKEAVKESVRSGLSKALQVNGVQQGNSFFSTMTKEMFDNLIWEELLNEGVKRKNYFLFSTSELHYKGKAYTAGVGIFGKVFVFSEVEKQTSQRVNDLIKSGGGLKEILGFEI